jgi:hypothetical protein
MIYMWFTGVNYYKLAVEKDRDSIFTTITTIWQPGLQGYIQHYLAFVQTALKVPMTRNFTPYVYNCIVKIT